jgi:tellurite methyltransferase
VERAIEGFHQDEHGDWVAELVCGHGQHVRHKPPFWQRPWVLAEDGRASRLGLPLDCVRCDRFELPDAFAPYKRTREFAAHSIPDGLLRDHTTARGVWGVIHVVAGRLRYIVEPPLAGTHVLDPEHPGIVVPEVRHRVAPDGAVRFYVEFYKRPPP